MNAVIPRDAAVEFGLGIHDQRVRVGPVRNPHLGAIQNKNAAALVRAQAHADHIGAGFRLTHGQRAHMFAADQFGQKFPLLLPGPIFRYLVHAQVGVGAVGKSNGRRRARYLLHRHHVLKVAQLRAAVILVYRDAQQPQLAQPPPDPPGKFVLAVYLRGNWRNLCLREFVHSVAHQRDGLAQLKIQSFHIDLPEFLLRHAAKVDSFTAARIAIGTAGAAARARCQTGITGPFTCCFGTTIHPARCPRPHAIASFRPP